MTNRETVFELVWTLTPIRTENIYSFNFEASGFFWKHAKKR